MRVHSQKLNGKNGWESHKEGGGEREERGTSKKKIWGSTIYGTWEVVGKVKRVEEHKMLLNVQGKGKGVKDIRQRRERGEKSEEKKKREKRKKERREDSSVHTSMLPAE